MAKGQGHSIWKSFGFSQYNFRFKYFRQKEYTFFDSDLFSCV